MARFRMSKGSGRRAASRLFNLKTLKAQPQPPKDTARTLKIQRAACYSHVSGYVSAHLAPCSCKKPLLSARGTHQDLYGEINSMMTIPAPGPKKNIHVKISRFSYGYIFITAFFVRKRFVEHFFLPDPRDTKLVDSSRHGGYRQRSCGRLQYANCV